MHLIMTDDSLVSGAFAIAKVVEVITPFHAAAKLLRTPQATLLYYWIARRRYRLFGCRDVCYVPRSS
jgi:predicted DCC family thiol-disulfide oxidoreductase YuxK